MRTVSSYLAAASITVAASAALGQGARVGSIPDATRLLVGADTFANFLGDERGPRTSTGLPYVLTVEQIAGRWRVVRSWLDSAGSVQTRGIVLTQPRSLLTEMDEVRAPRDSASLSVSSAGVVGWVVPEGQPAQLLSAPPGRPWMSGLVANLAVAGSKAPVGESYVIEQYALYAADPLRPRVDTLTVTAGPTFLIAGRPVRTRTVLRRNGAAAFFEEGSGRLIAMRGRAGPNWWWNVRIGATLAP